MPEKNPRSRLAVGLMSGTSMDGVDAALVRLSGPRERPQVRLLAFVTLPYPSAVRRNAPASADPERRFGEDLAEQEIELADFSGGRALTAGDLKQASLYRGRIGKGHKGEQANLGVLRRATQTDQRRVNPVHRGSGH